MNVGQIQVIGWIIDGLRVSTLNLNHLMAIKSSLSMHNGFHLPNLCMQLINYLKYNLNMQLYDTRCHAKWMMNMQLDGPKYD
jgi:hypothetical protein